MANLKFCPESFIFDSIDERNINITYLYINRNSIKSIIKWFKLSEDEVNYILEKSELKEYKVCKLCGKLKFSKDFTSGSYCKICKLKINKSLKIKNKEHYQEYDKNYRIKTNRYHDQKYNNSLAKYKIYSSQLDIYEEYRHDPNNLELIQCKCTYCGAWFNPTSRQIMNRIQYINGNINRESKLYCSINCKNECPIFGKQKDPSIIKINKDYNRESNTILRQIVFERDNYTCLKCNTHKNELTCGLHCHHINPVINDPISSNDPENCMTVCKRCHIKIHKEVDGCNYYQLKCK